MTSELKPCPFCGGVCIEGNANNPYNIVGGQQTNGPCWRTLACVRCWYIFCENDSPHRHPTARKEWLLEKWNTRVIDAENARLKELLKWCVEQLRDTYTCAHLDHWMRPWDTIPDCREKQEIEKLLEEEWEE